MDYKIDYLEKLRNTNKKSLELMREYSKISIFFYIQNNHPKYKIIRG